MTIRKDIIKLLGNEELTAKEISLNMNMKLNNIKSYVSILKKSNRIKIVNDKKPYKYKAVLTNLHLLKLLKQLHSIMKDIMDFNMKPNEKQIEIIKKVEAEIK